jgi:hypothetical protein
MSIFYFAKPRLAYLNLQPVKKAPVPKPVQLRLVKGSSS